MHISVIEIVLVVAVARSIGVHTVKDQLSRIRIINFHIAFGLAVNVINYFHQFEKEKSPRKKVNCIKEIYNCVYNVCKFNGDELVGADDEFPLLNYYLIK